MAEIDIPMKNGHQGYVGEGIVIPEVDQSGKEILNKSNVNDDPYCLHKILSPRNDGKGLDNLVVVGSPKKGKFFFNHNAHQTFGLRNYTSHGSCRNKHSIGNTQRNYSAPKRYESITECKKALRAENYEMKSLKESVSSLFSKLYNPQCSEYSFIIGAEYNSPRCVDMSHKNMKSPHFIRRSHVLKNPRESVLLEEKLESNIPKQKQKITHSMSPRMLKKLFNSSNTKDEVKKEEPKIPSKNSPANFITSSSIIPIKHSKKQDTPIANEILKKEHVENKEEDNELRAQMENDIEIEEMKIEDKIPDKEQTRDTEESVNKGVVQETKQEKKYRAEQINVSNGLRGMKKLPRPHHSLKLVLENAKGGTMKGGAITQRTRFSSKSQMIPHSNEMDTPRSSHPNYVLESHKEWVQELHKLDENFLDELRDNIPDDLQPSVEYVQTQKRMLRNNYQAWIPKAAKGFTPYRHYTNYRLAMKMPHTYQKKTPMKTHVNVMDRIGIE